MWEREIFGRKVKLFLTFNSVIYRIDTSRSAFSSLSLSDRKNLDKVRLRIMSSVLNVRYPYRISPNILKYVQ